MSKDDRFIAYTVNNDGAIHIRCLTNTVLMPVTSSQSDGSRALAADILLSISGPIPLCTMRLPTDLGNDVYESGEVRDASGAESAVNLQLPVNRSDSLSHTSDYNLLADLIVEDSNEICSPHWFPSTC